MPALVTFHERLMAHLPAIVDSVLETSGAAYDARRPRAAEPRPLSVPIEWLGREPSTAAAGRGWKHRYRARLRLTSLDAAERAGSAQIGLIAGHAAKLERHFAHRRVLLQELGDVVVVADAVVEAVDVDPEDEGGMEGAVLLTFHTRGTGDLDGTENPGG